MERMQLITPIIALATLILIACHDSSETRNSKTESILKKKDMTTYPAKNISISINRPADEVYQFASNPINFPKWVKFVKSITREGDIWLAKTELGSLKIEFVPQNNFGIIDHLVTLPDSTTVNNHLRVITNGKGSEMIFTLFWMPGRTEEEFNQDAEAVKSDLETVKKIIESK